jgi:hypothetical protein
MKRLLVLILALMLLTAPLMAQQIEATPAEAPTPINAGVLILLLGFGAVMAIGFVMAGRSNAEQDQ